MSDNLGAAFDRDGMLENFVADLALVAYRVALRHGTAGMWVDLELDLWRALSDTVNMWGRESLPGSEATFARDWAGDQSEAVDAGGRDGLGYWRDPGEPLSTE